MNGSSQQSVSIAALSGQKIFVGCMAIAFIGAICAAVAGYVLQNNVELLHRLGVSGVFVSDAVSLRDTANVYWGRRAELEVTWMPIIGVMQFYWAGILWGSLAVCALNIFLILSAAYYFFETIKTFVSGNRQLLLIFAFVTLSIVGNIYLIEVMAFPNKEIPLLAITNAYVYYLVVRRSYIAPAILSTIAFVFRDGYGVILIGCLVAFWALRNKPLKTRLGLIGLMVAIFTLMPISSFMEISNIVARNVESGLLAHQYEQVNGQLGYLSRLKYNTLSLGLFSSFLTDRGRLDLLNVGFWQLGVFVIAGILWATKQILTKANELEFGISIVILVVFLCISYGTFVQPRYLMPLSYFLALGFVRCVKCGGIAVSLSVVVPAFLLLRDIPHRAPEMLDAATWSW